MKNQKLISTKEIICIGILLIFSCIIFEWTRLTTSDIENIGFNNESVVPLNNEFKLKLNNQEITTTLPTNINAHANDKVTLSTTLCSKDLNGNCIGVYARQAYVQIYINDELMMETNPDMDLPFKVSPGSRWYLLRLPQHLENFELKLCISNYFDKYATDMPAIYSGNKSSFLYMILYRARFSLIFGITTFTLGFTCILLGLLLRKKNITNRFTLLGLLSVTLSIWYMLESRITQVFWGNFALTTFVLFICYNLIPVFASALLLTFEFFNSKYMRIVFWLSSISFAIVNSFQLLGIACYMEMLSSVHILIILLTIGIFLSYFTNSKNKAITITNKYEYKSFLILVAFGLVDLIYYYIPMSDKSVGNFIRVGMLVFIIYLAYHGLKQFYIMELDLVRHKIYKELAFKDLMTSLANRSLFEQDMLQLKNDIISPENNIFFYFVDVNNLKLINDTYGHNQGDDCIIKVANLLSECFTSPSKAYRIGGDEFCIICKGFTYDELSARTQYLTELVEKTDAETNYPFSIATGFHIIDDDGVDACLKKADAIMYENKKAIKAKLHINADH